MLLIKNGRVMDPATGTDAVTDILIEDGRIRQMGNGLSADQVLDASGLVVAPGLIDTHVHFRDPGFTHKEDLHTGALAAARGGFTTVVCLANTKPVADCVPVLEDILGRGRQEAVRLLQAASVTLGQRGETLVDMAALKKAGAACFTDDGIPIESSALLREAFRQAAELDVVISLHEEDPALIGSPGVNAGAVAAQFGLAGAPAVAEDCLVARDCMLALETGARVVIQHISSKRAVNMVRFAKSLGARVEAEATPHHFSLTEQAVVEHGTLAKMNPPLRGEEDRIAIIQGLADGTIGIIATDHAPHAREEKALPFAQAPSGIIGLETALSLGITHLVGPGHLTLMKLLGKMTSNPAALYRLEGGRVAEGEPADLVLFDPEARWRVEDFASKSDNSPFVGQSLDGVVQYTLCRGQIVYQNP